MIRQDQDTAGDRFLRTLNSKGGCESLSDGKL